MSDVAIRVEGLGKMYRLGANLQSYGSMRETLSGIARIPTQAARRVARRESAEKSRRQEFWALKDVGFEVKAGESLGIVGGNGAGKSTLLKLLSEITEPTEGRITIKGRVASLLEVGTGFHPELSGRENIYLNGAILGMSKVEIACRFDEIVAFAEVERFLDTQVKHYSSGMYMRLAFSVAAHLEQEILLVDEVLSVGDVAFQRKCLGKMEEASSSGKTVLFVSHNLESIQHLCRTGLLLENGRNVALGPIEGIVSKYMAAMPRSAKRAEPSDTENQDRFRVCSIETLDLNGSPLDAVRTWDAVCFRITYHAPYPLKAGAVAFQLASKTGAVLIFTSTQPDHQVKVEIKEGSNVIDCIFPRLPLAAGHYMMGAGIAIANLEYVYNGLEDWDLDVMPRDVFDSGLAPHTGRSFIAIAHHWALAKRTLDIPSAETCA